MASSFFIKQLPLALTLLYLSLYGFKLGRGQPGIAGTGIGYIPQPGGGGAAGGSGGSGGGFGGGGSGGGSGEAEELISKALLCLSDKYIYSSCEESYRLTESGELHVPPEYTNQYCSGPCLKETHLVLNCIDGILSHFFFYNRATIGDVKETIKAGCSNGPNRGDFNVAEHIQAYESNSYRLSHPIFFGLVPLMFVGNLLF